MSPNVWFAKYIAKQAQTPDCSYLLLQASETTLEEFLEELETLTAAVAEEPKDSNTKVVSSSVSLSTSDEASGSAAPPTKGATDEASPRNSEKKVRFAEKLYQEAHMRKTMTQDSASIESTPVSSLKASSPKIKPLESAKKDEYPQDQGGGPSASSVAQQQSTESACTEKDSSLSTAPTSPSTERASGSVQGRHIQAVELAKSNIRNSTAGMTKCGRPSQV